MKRLKIYATMLFLLVVSPVYVPAVILYEYREDAFDFYKDAFLILTFKHRLMKDKK